MAPLLAAALLLLPRLAAPRLSVRYFAYGSNMAAAVLTGVRRISPLEKRCGVVRDHRLAFTVPGFALEPSFASCDPAKGERLHGVCYSLTLADWLRLCASEGVPAAYRVTTVDVHCYDGAELPAYTLSAALPLPVSLPPSRRYLNLLRQGAREAGLDPEWQRKLEEMEPFFLSV
ncbi:hypothetical protein AB1Y20_022803 [Prymnesium parvum]|uniref:gamma-glutamylcyclotransferase n=1 Tax=Prymnesium parvum TaxID=97485 RepID=A0AB34JC26_PRYPA